MLYNPTDEEITSAVEKLTDAFSERPGFPKTETSLCMIAKGFCRIVWQKKTSEIPAFEGQEHPVIGDVRDDEWLIEQALERRDRFPSLIDFRRIYEEFLPPRDGRSSNEMSA